MATPAELLAQSLAKFQTANRIDGTKNSYRKDNPAEYTKVIAYLQGGARPTGVTSDMGMGLMLEEDARRALVVPPPPGVTPPTPPSAYVVPVGATAVSTAAQLITALASSPAKDIVLANGTYDNASAFSNGGGHRLYAQNLGGATLSAGLMVGGNYGTGGAIVRGLKFNVNAPAKSFQGGLISTWGPAGANAQVLDCVFEGNWVVPYGVYAVTVEGLDVRRSEFRHFTDEGMRASDNVTVPYGSATPHIKALHDLLVDGVSRPTPGGSNGQAEAGLFIGHPVDEGVQRIKIHDIAAAGIETVNNSWDTTFSDLDIDMGGTHQWAGVAVYLEHFSMHDTFEDFDFRGAHRGFNGEWNYGTPGNAGAQHTTIRNGVINTTGNTLGGNTAGVYLDEGCDSTIVTGVTFKNQNWAGIGAYLNIGTNDFSGNTFQMLPGAVQVSTEHI